MKKSFLHFLGKYKYEIVLVVVVLLALLVRLYSFDKRMVFDSEQARSLIVSGNYINDKFSLLGQEYFRTTSSGHKLFSGALFGYSLIPLQKIFNFNAYPITIYFSLLNVLTGVLVYIIGLKVVGKKIAIIASTLFLFNDLMIKHSLFIWILNYMPLVGILALYLVFKYFKKYLWIDALLLGLLMGVGVNLHYPVIFFAGVIGLILITRRKLNLLHLVLYCLGLLLGNLPTVLFDIRHNWYHVITLYQYFLDTISGNGQNFSYYYLFFLWPAFSISAAWALTKLVKNKFLIIAILLLYVVINLTSKWISFGGANEMPKGLKYSDVMKASEIIYRDNPTNFNVSTLFGFDARGYILRYPLQFNFHVKPRGEEEYKNIEALYVMANGDNDIKKPSRYELTSFQPYHYVKLNDVNESYQIYKLTKQ